ncbi:MAG: IS21-like element helper ATPase IstB, partial [Candidatus Babeliales bacterium]
MLIHPLLEKLRQLRCYGMLEVFQEHLQSTDIQALSFEERLSWMIEREWWHRENRRMKTRLRQASLRQTACMEDIDYSPSRGLSKSVMLQLASCQWIREQHNIIFIGATGTGKSYLACALSHKACLEGFSVRYLRLPRLFQELALARGDGRYLKLMQQLAKTQVLVLDDWGLSVMDDIQRRDLLEILDDRHQRSCTIITSQLPIKHWHESIGDPTLADAILDRLIHNAHKIELKGESMRKKRNQNDKKFDFNGE